MNQMPYDQRKRLRAALQGVPYLKEALRAFRSLDCSLRLTIGDDWLASASKDTIIADIDCYLAGHYVPDENGKLHSIFTIGTMGDRSCIEST